MQVAVLGLGRMGSAIAGLLLDGDHHVAVWNRSPGHADPLVAAGGREASSITEAVRDVDIVIASLSNDDAVEEVALGDGGVRGAIGDDALYLEASTVSPQLTGRLEQEFPHFAAMPVLGSPAVVAAGQATLLIGGAPDAVTRAEPLLHAISPNVRRFANAPMASTAKLASNLLLLAGVAALAESFAVAHSGGLSDDDIRALLGESPLVAPAIRNRFEGVLTGKHEPWWGGALGAKDARLAAELAETAGVELPLARLVSELYDEAGGDDIVEIRERYVR
jgi:3-hydroxyisobutyrate dehydrogenase-like beta-hydroxyacid dehydrogenase